MPPKPGLQAWWRAHVRNHPRLDQDRTDPEGWAGPISGGKHKLYCKRCFDLHIANVQQEDAAEVARGERANVRDIAQIESYCKSSASFVIINCVHSYIRTYISMDAERCNAPIRPWLDIIRRDYGTESSARLPERQSGRQIYCSE
jgi:hypothetical protein